MRFHAQRPLHKGEIDLYNPKIDGNANRDSHEEGEKHYVFISIELLVRA